MWNPARSLVGIPHPFKLDRFPWNSARRRSGLRLEFYNLRALAKAILVEQMAFG